MVYALLSWFPGGYQSGLGRLLAKICEPYISLFDRLPLRIGPLDFTILGSNPDLELSRTRFSTDRYMDNCPFSLLIEATKSLFSE